MKIHVAGSHSRLKDLHQCGFMGYHKYVLKDLPPIQSNEFLEYGKQVHNKMELHINNGAELPVQLAPLAQIVSKFRAAYPNEFRAEVQLAVNANWEPTDWFAKDVMFRSICDVLGISEDRRRAVHIDWKTGKVKDDLGQLRLGSAVIMSHYPDVEEVQNFFIWTEHKHKTPLRVTDDQYYELQEEFEARLLPIQQWYETGQWEKKPSRLCRWCPLSPAQCEHRRQDRRYV